MSDYMWMRSQGQALDEIASLIHLQASCKEQDKWLKAAIKLGYVEIELEEEE
jgi:disulfide oxidoreductase YuzD